MSASVSHKVFLLAPRVVGLAVSAFLAMFALDAFDGRPVLEALPGFFLHLLPAFVVAAVVAMAWRREWIGAATCLVLAAAYAASVPQRPDWILVISGPLVLAAALYAVAWRVRRIR
ncbi:MAG: hypothetical protein R2752_05355 [Vicinamibacterales bacterium]